MIIDEKVLEHYGTKTKQRKKTQPENLGRIFRVEAGTTTRRARIQKVKQALETSSEDVPTESLDEFLNRVCSVKLCDINI
jgi:hypothetical protein